MAKTRAEINLKHRYGISMACYLKLLKKQNYKCFFCLKKHTNKNKLHVDHCHDSKKVRGLLCKNCNVALGYLEKNRYRLDKFFKYIDNIE